ncbi:MAG: hypothetical protein AAFZ15_16350 [Bacteroidota bacterium]
MWSEKLTFSFFLISFFWLASCAQQEIVNNQFETSIKEEQPIKPKYGTKNPFVGWSCPDNLRGFPPVNIQELDQVPVVNGRLPTEEETMNGTSLIYLDTAEYQNARALDMTMPRLARFYSDYTKKNELVIVIQAVVVFRDTMVGFRYLNGGNGSAYLGEVSFVSDEEMDKLGATPFVAAEVEINAPKERIDEIITDPAYAKDLGEMFDKNAYVESDWQNDSKVYFKYGPDKVVSTGIVTASWDNLYYQVDYNFDGYHYAEKFLILENAGTKSTQLIIAAGPYSQEDIDAQKIVWNNWLQKVKELSEDS